MDSPLAALSPEQDVLHRGRRATFLHMSGGVAIIRHRGDSHAVAVPPEALSMVLEPADEPMTRDANATD